MPPDSQGITYGSWPAERSLGHRLFVKEPGAWKNEEILVRQM